MLVLTVNQATITLDDVLNVGRTEGIDEYEIESSVGLCKAKRSRRDVSTAEETFKVMAARATLT